MFKRHLLQKKLGKLFKIILNPPNPAIKPSKKLQFIKKRNSKISTRHYTFFYARNGFETIIRSPIEKENSLYLWTSAWKVVFKAHHVNSVELRLKWKSFEAECTWKRKFGNNNKFYWKYLHESETFRKITETLWKITSKIEGKHKVL